MSKIRVMLADDNRDFRTSLADYLQSKTDVEVIATVGNGEEAERTLEKNTPDILLMELVMPLMDGFALMERVRNVPQYQNMRIIVISSLVRDNFVRQAMAMGAHYYMAKPCDPEIVYMRLRECYRFCAESMLENVIPNLIEVSLGGWIHACLTRAGISAALKGHKFLADALRIVLENPGRRSFITKEIYPVIAAKHGTSVQAVERAIRSAIDTAWKHGSLKNMGCFTDRPSNGDFILRAAAEKNQ